MNQYICRVCKGNECTVLTSQGPPNCGCLHNSDIGALWEQDSFYKSEREKVLDDFVKFVDAYSRQGEDGHDYVSVIALQTHIVYLRQAGES